MNEESKKFIRLAKEILKQENVTQNSVNNAINYIRQAIEQIKKEKYEVTSIELNDIVIKKSEKTKQLTPTIMPTTAKDKTLTYESGNTGFFTVDNNGLLTYINEGEDRIKVAASNGVTTYAKVSCVDDEKIEEKPTEVISNYTGIAISNDDKEMYLGLPISLNATVFPYDVYGENKYIVTSSDTSIIGADEEYIVKGLSDYPHVLIPKKCGKVTITASTIDKKFSDSITIEVKEIPIKTFKEEEIYYINNNDWNIVQGQLNTLEEAKKNSQGFNSALLWAKNNGFRKVVLEKGFYHIDPTSTIHMRSDVFVDMNESEFKLFPNTANNYHAIFFKEGSGENLIEQKTYNMNTTSLNKNEEYVLPLENVKVISPTNKDNLYADKIKIGDIIKIQIKEISNNALNPWQLGCRMRMDYLLDNNIVGSEDIALHYHYNPIINRIQLEKDINYNSITISLVLKNTTSTMDVNIYAKDLKIYRISEEVLHDAELSNGTITGERDEKSTVYPNWANNGSTEGGCSIIFNEGNNNGISKLNVRKSIGFNIASSTGSDAYNTLGKTPNTYIQSSLLEEGSFDDEGNPIEKEAMFRLNRIVDITPHKKNGTLEISYGLGYHGYDKLRARVSDLYFLDDNEKVVAIKKGVYNFKSYEIPKEATKLKIAFHWNLGVPTSGDSDFGGSIGFVSSYRTPIHNFMYNCIIEDNYSCGFANCGGQKFIIKDNIFRRNTGRMPSCDIDWEDGWEFMQDNIVIGNTFESYNGIIVCAGNNFLFTENEFNGINTFWGRSQNMNMFNNNIKGKLDWSSQTDSRIINNNISSQVSTGANHGSNAKYYCTLEGNTFKNGSIANVSNKIVKNNKFIGRITVRESIININNCQFSKEGTEDVELCFVGEKTIKDCIFDNISPRLYISQAKENDLHTIFNNCLFNNSMPYNFNNILGVFNNCIFENTPSIEYCGAEFNNCKLNNVKSNLVNIYNQKAIDTVFNNTEIILDTNNTNPLVNIAWRSGEDIYNFYFNNCVLPANYVFCPSNKTNWIKQIIK